jgi:hypothetical protein
MTRRKTTRKRTKIKSRTRTKPGNDKRYDKLYLLERVSNKTKLSIWTGQHEVKIGVTSQTVEQRRENIDLDLAGDVVLITWLHLPETAYRHEQRLLKKYSDRAFNPGGGSGAGNTEWLRVTWLIYIFILLDYQAIKYRALIHLICFAVIIVFFLYVYLEAKSYQ